MNINLINLSTLFEDDYSEELIKNTLCLLSICQKFKVKRCGIGTWDKEFKNSKSWIRTFYNDERYYFYKDGLTKAIFVKDNFFCDGKTKIGRVKAWEIVKEFDEINDYSYSCGCGNFGQHTLRTDKFIKGIYTFKENKWNFESLDSLV